MESLVNAGIFSMANLLAVVDRMIMEKTLATRFAEKTGQPDLVDLLATRLSAHELNSLLLEVFQRRTRRSNPADVLRRYRQNRFVQPAKLEALTFRSFESGLLELAQRQGFILLELSPLAPLGSCSAVATVPQNNVVSALRGTEAVADATNVLALESAHRRSQTGFSAEPLRFCAAHRHVRAQSLMQPHHTAHFKIFCLTTAGRDTGSFAFERQHLFEHWDFYHTFLVEKLGLSWQIRLKSLAADTREQAFIGSIVDEMRARGWAVEMSQAAPQEQPYYQILQAKMVVQVGGMELEIADSGLTDWTQRLTGNRKERFMISGLGSELLFKMLLPPI